MFVGPGKCSAVHKASAVVQELAMWLNCHTGKTELQVRLGRIKAALTVLILSCVGDGLAASCGTEPKC